MKANKNLSIVFKSLFVVACAALFSFSSGKGGDSFEIYLNGKLLVKQYLYDVKEAKSLQLTQTSANDQLDVYYSHCGHIGTNRCITIKNEKDQPLKVWKLQDAVDKNGAMSFKLKDILSLRKNKTDKLNLFYSSSELPSGRTLAVIAGEETGVARK